MKKIRTISLTVKSMGAPKEIHTYIYSGEIYNYERNQMEIIEMTGIDRIGTCKAPTQKTRHEIDGVLKPMNMTSNDLT